MSASGILIGARLTRRLKEIGIKEAELARRAGVPQPTVHRILSGAVQSPKTENVEKLAETLGLTLTEVLSERLKEGDQNVVPGPTITGKVPVVSWVTAGTFNEAIDLHSPGVAEEWLDCPFPHSRSAYCLIVKGLSMFPDYRPNEIILVEPELDARHGDDVIVRTPPPDSETTFKRLQVNEDGMMLMAVNPDWPERFLRLPYGSTISGVVTGSWIKRRCRK